MPGAFGVTTIVIVALLDTASVPIEQVIVVVPLHVPALLVAETRVTPGGSVSVRVTPVAVEGPAFPTLIV